MFQPSPRMRHEDWLALSEAELAALTADSADTPEPIPLADPLADAPASLAWEDLGRALLEKRKREASLAALLLSAAQAAEDDLVARGLRPSQRDPYARAFRVEAALALDMSEPAAATLLFRLDAVRRWLPGTWAAFRAGRADLRAIQTVAREMDGLDLTAHADGYDAGVIDAFDRIPGSRLSTHLHMLRERLQADTAEIRHREAMQRCGAEVELARDGMATLTLTGPAEDVLAMDDALQRAAVIVHGRADENRSITNLRYCIARDLLLGGIRSKADVDGSEVFTMTVPSRPAIVATINVTVPALTLLGRGPGSAELDGYGPIDPVTARRLAGGAACWTRVLTDPVTDFRLTLDANRYRLSKPLRRWLQLRDGSCRFPGCGRPATRSDVDHQHEWHEGGRSDPDNLAHLCRKHHLMKSTGVWRTRHDRATDRIIWTSPARREWVSEPAPPTPASPAHPDLAPCPF